MTEFVTLYVMLCCATAMGLYFQRSAPGLRWQIRPVTVLVFAYWLYSSALPASVMFFGHVVGAEELRFMIAAALGAGGYTFGAVCFRHKMEKIPDAVVAVPMAPAVRYNAARVSVFLVTAATVTFFVRFLVAAGFNISNLFAYYGYEAVAGTTNAALEILGGHVALAVSVLGLILSLRSTRVVTRYVLTLMVIVSAVYTLRGMRLWAMMTMLPAVIVVFHRLKIRPYVFILVGSGAFLLIQIVGAIRDIGFGDVQDVHIGSTAFDPVRNEFGTSYKVFSLCDEFGYFDQKRWGATYTTEAALVCIPHVIWPGRPDGLAIQLALVATDQLSREDLTLAYGFSNLAEAVINFGLWGVPAVFFGWYCVFVYLSRNTVTRGAWGCAAYAMLGSMAVLVNRMDTTMVIKVYAVLVAAAFCGDMLTRQFSVRPQATGDAARSGFARMLR